MSDRAIAKILRATVVIGVVFAVSGSVVLILEGHADLWWSKFGVHNAAATLPTAVLVWLVSRRQPRNKAVWVMAVTSFAGVYVFGLALAAILVKDDPARVLGVSIVPAEIPPAAAWALATTVPSSVLAFYSLLTLGLLLFPDGRLPSPRWRPVAVLSIGAVAMAMVAEAWVHRPASLANSGALQIVGRITFGMAALLSLGALLGRFRHSSGPTRQQFKWIAWGAAIWVPIVVANVVLAGTRYEEAIGLPSLMAGVVFFASYGIAVGKYRLYDVDLVISRTFVYGVLAIFITGVYVAAVVGVGTVLGTEDQPNTVLAIAATTVVAVVFQPLRRRLQRVANRLVYGRRATPYEVLSTFSQSIAAVDPDVLGQIARSLAEGTTAEAAAVWMKRDELQLMAAWPPDAFESAARATNSGKAGEDRSMPVIHDGEQLGLVTLHLPAGQPFSPADEGLFEQVASGLGLALRNLKLTEDLRARVEQLRESRRRIVAVQDRTRRRLERDLHDGAQQRLVALKIKLGLGASMADKAELEDVSGALADLRTETDRAIESIRDFARGIYPPLLESDGLGVALATYVRKLPLPVTVHAVGIGRHSRDVEATVYFCVLEALDNALEHSQANSVTVYLRATEEALGFEVRDDGVGYEPEETNSRSGLANIADRVHALGGSLEVDSSPGRGTILRGTVPSRVMEPAT